MTPTELGKELEKDLGVQIHFLSLIESDPRHPQLTRLSGNQKWVKYDNDNLLPQRIIDLTRLSPTHSSILHKKAGYIAGDRIEVDPSAQAWADSLDYGDGISQLFYKCALDYVTHGSFATQMIMNPMMLKLQDVLFQDWTTVRKGFGTEVNPTTGKSPQGVWISDDWLHYSYAKFSPTFHEMFKFNDFFAGKNEYYCDESLYYVKQEYTQSMRFYSLPSWWSALRSIQTEIELLNFKFSVVNNSFVPSGILKVPTSIKPDVVEKLKQQIKEEMTGSDNAGKIMIIPSDGEDAVEWIPYTQHGGEKDVTNYLEQARMEIIIAHQLPSPTVIGLPGGASLGGDGGTIEMAATEFFKDIRKVQSKLVTEFQKMLRAAGYPDTFNIVQTIPDGAQQTTTVN